MSGKLLKGKKTVWETTYDCDGGGNGTIYELKDQNDVLAKVFKYDCNTPDVNVINRKKRFFYEIDFLRKYSLLNLHMPIMVDECSEDEIPFFVIKKYHDIKWLYDKHLTIENKIDLCIQLIDAIEFIHSTGTAHRDIKPKNLLFEEKDGQIILILTDYGLISSDDLDSPGDKIGSYGYTPPELRSRNINTDCYFQSDVYEFAKTVYAFLSNVLYTFSEGVSIIGEGDEIRVGSRNTLFLEPIYEMIEKSIKYEMDDRITIARCRKYLNEAKNLLTTTFSTEWSEKREKRRVLSVFINKSNYSISDRQHISLFVSSILKNGYDLQLDDKRLVVKGIDEKPYPGNDSLLLYELLFNQNEKMLFLIEHIIISNNFEEVYDLYIKNVGNDYMVSNVIMNYKAVKKRRNEISNDFKLPN